MHITVLGTSNSLMRHGYVFALRNHPYVTSVENFSLGGSSALAFTAMVSDDSPVSNRYCILDYAVNQHSFLRQGHHKETIKDEIVGCVAALTQRGGLPVFLLLPRQRCDAKSSRIRAIYLELSEALGVPVFDGIAWTDVFSCINGIDRTTLFKDDGHLAPWVATALAVDLVDFLGGIKAKSSSSQVISVDARRYCTARLPTARSVVTRENSLFSQSFSVLEPCEEATVRVPNASVVCGIALNIPMSSVAIEFTGEGETLQLDFRNGFSRRNGPSFIHVAVSFPKSILPMDGQVRMRLLKQHEIHHDAFRMFPSRRPVGATDTAEISTLICASRGKTATPLTPYEARDGMCSNIGPASITARLMRLLYSAGAQPEDSAVLDV